MASSSNLGTGSIFMCQEVKNVLRVLRDLDHLGPVRVNRSTYYLVSFQRDSRRSIADKVPGRFLDKENIIVVLLRLKKSINQHIVLANVL